MRVPKIYKTLLTLSFILSFIGLTIIGREIYRKSNHKEKILAEMAVVIEEVQKKPKSPPVYDEEGDQVQTEEDVKATTAAWKMNCLTSLVSKGWKPSVNCELLIMNILDDQVDRQDLTFQANKGLILRGLFLLFAPLYLLILKTLWCQLRLKFGFS